MCHRSVGLIQHALEAAGIPAVSITHLPRVSTKIGVSRSVHVPWPLGQAFGPAGDQETHRAVVLSALSMLAQGPGLREYDRRYSSPDSIIKEVRPT